MMQSLGRRYVRYVNDRYHRTGTPHDRLIRAHRSYLALGGDNVDSGRARLRYINRHRCPTQRTT